MNENKEFYTAFELVDILGKNINSVKRNINNFVKHGYIRYDETFRKCADGIVRRGIPGDMLDEFVRFSSGRRIEYTGRVKTRKVKINVCKEWMDTTKSKYNSLYDMERKGVMGVSRLKKLWKKWLEICGYNEKQFVEYWGALKCIKIPVGFVRFVEWWKEEGWKIL